MQHPRSSEAALTSLPGEIIESLYGYLSIHDQLQLLRTCKLLRDIWISSAALQYRFTLHTSAYLDVPPFPHVFARSRSATPESMSMDPDDEANSVPSVTFAIPSRRQLASRKPVPAVDHRASTLEKTLALKERERRWETIDPAVTRSLKIDGPVGVYELQEGIFIMCGDSTDGRGTVPRSIRLIPLPSAQDPDLENPIIPVKSHRLDYSISDLTMDPTQDLIVVSETDPRPIAGARNPTHRYHLLTLSTFQPHPMATLPTLDFPPCTEELGLTRQLLQVMDDVLIVFVSRYVMQWLFAALEGFGGGAPFGHEEEIVCWNWKTGKVLGRIGLPENGWFSSIAMLTPTSFMITSTSSISPVLPSGPRSRVRSFPPVIQIYTFLPDPVKNINPVQPLRADYMDDTTPRPILVAELGMPEFSLGALVTGFEVRPDPPFPPSKSLGCGTRKAFTQDPEKGVMVFEFTVLDPPDPQLGEEQHRQTHQYELFILREKLVQLAKDGEERLRTQFAAREKGRTDYAHWRVEETIPWSEWGEYGTRMLEGRLIPRTWVCSCSGYRFVSLVPRESEDSDASDDEDQFDRLHPRPRLSDIRIFDFSPYNIHKPLAEEIESDEVDVTVRKAPTVLDKKKIWQHDITTRLPYQEINRRQGVVANGVMIDDQRVMAICTRGRANGDWSNVRQEMTVYCM